MANPPFDGIPSSVVPIPVSPSPFTEPLFMSDNSGGTDSAQWPLLAADRQPSTRSMDSSSRGSRALGSLGSLEEGVAQLSSGDTPSFRNSAHSSTEQSRHVSTFSTNDQRPPVSSHNRFPSVPQWHSSPVREPTSSRPSRSSISDLFRHRNLETLDSSEQNLASLVHHGDNAIPQTSPAQSSRRQPMIPWRFLSSPPRHGHDGSRYDEGLPISTSGSRDVHGSSDANPMMPDGMPLVTSGSAGTMSDEGRMVAHDSGMMTNQRMRQVRFAIVY